MKNLQNVSTIREVQEQALLMLSEYSVSSRHNNQQQPILQSSWTQPGPSSRASIALPIVNKLRFAKLMLLLPTLWSIRAKSIEIIFFKKNEETVKALRTILNSFSEASGDKTD